MGPGYGSWDWSWRSPWDWSWRSPWDWSIYRDISMGWALAIPHRITHPVYPHHPGYTSPTAPVLMSAGSACWTSAQRLRLSVKTVNSGQPIYHHGVYMTKRVRRRAHTWLVYCQNVPTFLIEHEFTRFPKIRDPRNVRLTSRDGKSVVH